MATEITTRAAKGAPLTYVEVDANFENLRDTADAAFDATIALGGKANASAIGISDTDTNMGAFSGSIIPDGQSAKQSIQALENSQEGYRADILSTASGKGAGLVGFSQASTYGAGTLGAKATQLQSPLDAPYLATGDGVADDTSAINVQAAAIPVGSQIILPAGKKFRVASWVNDLGHDYFGGGSIVIGTGSAAYKLNSYARARGFVFGRENKYAFDNAVNTAGSLWDAFIYGDSTVATTANGGIPGDPNTPDVILRDYLENNGVRNIGTFTNRGNGGANFSNANPVPDLGVNTKLLVFKFSINHVSGQDVAAEIAAMRAVLSAVRADANGGWDKVTIVICSGNSTHDTAGGRTSLWYEQLLGGFQQAAYDFGCVFVDIYGLFPDSRRWAGFYSDTPSVHPQDLLRQQLWAPVGEVLAPHGAFQLSTGNRWIDITGVNNWTNNVGGNAFQVSLSADGFVDVRGSITRASGTPAADEEFGSLPNNNYVPDQPSTGTAWTYNGATWRSLPVLVNVDGTIEPRNADAYNTLVVLDGIRYSVKA